MRIVLLTGRLASRKIREIASEIMKKHTSLELDVIELPIDVAALISDKYLLSILPRIGEKLAGADLIIVPGYSQGDMSIVANAIGKPVIKGPKHLHDIPLFIEMILKGVEFSPLRPADDVLYEIRSTISRRVLESLRDKARNDNYFTIGDVPISRHYPIVILELYPRSIVDIAEVKRSIEYADLVSIGVSINEDPRDYIELVKLVKDGYRKPVGIDVYDIDQALLIAEYVDMINGVKLDELDRVFAYKERLRYKGIVIVDDKLDPNDIKNIVLKLREDGFKKIIVDPVLKPPLTGLIHSLLRIHRFKSIAPDIPVLIGAGNVTEMADVDSIGLNAMLAFIGVELGVEVFLTTEASPKTKGSTFELRRALDMALIAKEYSCTPKDLGIHLLCLKDKRKITQSYPRSSMRVLASNVWRYGVDPRGFFKIFVDHSSKKIILQHYEYGKTEPVIEIIGDDPGSILKEVIERGLASSPDHFFYLGYELAKAEIALILGKNYIQEARLFEFEYP